MPKSISLAYQLVNNCTLRGWAEWRLPMCALESLYKDSLWVGRCVKREL